MSCRSSPHQNAANATGVAAMTIGDFPHHRCRGARARRSHLLRLRTHLFDVADVQERLFRDRVDLAAADRVEALERFGDLDVLAFLAGELLRDVEGLAEEALDLARAADDELVFFAQLIDPEDGDDVLEVAVALEHLLDLAGDAEVLLA